MRLYDDVITYLPERNKALYLGFSNTLLEKRIYDDDNFAFVPWSKNFKDYMDNNNTLSFEDLVENRQNAVSEILLNKYFVEDYGDLEIKKNLDETVLEISNTLKNKDIQIEEKTKLNTIKLTSIFDSKILISSQALKELVVNEGQNEINIDNTTITDKLEVDGNQSIGLQDIDIPVIDIKNFDNITINYVDKNTINKNGDYKINLESDIKDSDIVLDLDFESGANKPTVETLKARNIRLCEVYNIQNINAVNINLVLEKQNKLVIDTLYIPENTDTIYLYWGMNIYYRNNPLDIYINHIIKEDPDQNTQINFKNMMWVYIRGQRIRSNTNLLSDYESQLKANVITGASEDELIEEAPIETKDNSIEKMNISNEDNTKATTIDLTGKEITIIGPYKNFKHSISDYKKMIKQAGAHYTANIDSNTHYILTDAVLPNDKLQKAIDLGIKQLTQDDFLKIINK